jgi:hypothetical protein
MEWYIFKHKDSFTFTFYLNQMQMDIHVYWWSMLSSLDRNLNQPK